MTDYFVPSSNQAWKLSLYLRQTLTIRQVAIPQAAQEIGGTVELIFRLLNPTDPPINIAPSILSALAKFCLKPQNMSGQLVFSPDSTFGSVEEFVQYISTPCQTHTVGH